MTASPHGDLADAWTLATVTVSQGRRTPATRRVPQLSETGAVAASEIGCRPEHGVHELSWVVHMPESQKVRQLMLQERAYV